MKYKVVLISILIIFSLVSCNNQNSKKHIRSEEIVLIFKNAPDHNMFTFPSGTRLGNLPFNLISYIDSNGLSVEYSPLKDTDTLVIQNLKKSFLEILHKFQGFEDIYYLFQAGDTIEITYDNYLYPFARSYTSEKLTKQYNFQSNIKNRKDKFGFESLSLIKNQYIRLLYNYKIENPIKYETVLKDVHINFVEVDSLKNNFTRYTYSYQNLLDSLQKENLLSKTYFNYYNYLLRIKHLIYSISELKYANKNNNYLQMNTEYHNIFNDSLINYISYNRLLNDYIYDALCKAENITMFQNINSSYYDTRQVFENLNSDETIPIKTKETLLFYCMEGIIENFSVEDIQKYLSKYIQLTKDSIKANFLISKNNLDFKSGNDLLLTNIDASQITFNNLLEKHKGKLIYVDFWASWCNPCRESMPYAKNLRNDYVGKNVVFIYLALNDQKRSWENAIQKLGLNNNCENYIISNSKTAKMLEELKVNAIPRYMLFNKKGKLIYQNAHSPESKEIRELLNRHLLE